MLHRARFLKVCQFKKEFGSTFCPYYAYNSTARPVFIYAMSCTKSVSTGWKFSKRPFCSPFNQKKCRFFLEYCDNCIITNLFYIKRNTVVYISFFWNTARPWDTLFLVPEKYRAAQNRTSWGLYLCTKWDFFPKNSVSARLLAKIRVSQGYCYVVQCTLHLLRS